MSFGSASDPAKTNERTLKLARGGSRIGRLIRKEVTTILRDRRTITTLLLMPILLYPLLTVAFRQFLLARQLDVEKPYAFRIGVLDAQKLGQGTIGLLSFHFLRGEEELWKRFSTDEKKRAEDRTYKLERNRQEKNLLGVGILEDSMEAHLRNGSIDVGIEIRGPDKIPNRALGVDRRNRRLLVTKDHTIELTLVALEGSLRSQEALRYLERVLAAANELSLEEVVKRRSEIEPGGPPAGRLSVYRLLIQPLESDRNVLASLIPLILIMMTITGAVYPAIDLTAGERERGTIEILVAAPVPRMSLLFAKYVSVLVVAFLTALMNLASMTVCLQVTGLGPHVLPAGISLKIIVQVTGLLALIAAFYSAALLAMSSFARTFKEAQLYVIPLMTFSLFVALLSLLPDLEAKGALLIVPLLNVVLLAAGIFKGGIGGAAVLIVVLSTLLYSLTMIAVAARLFGAEAVLYSEQSGLGDMLRRPREPSAVPSVSNAMLCLALMFPAHFLITNALRGVSFDVMLAMIPVVSLILFVGFPLAFCGWSRVRLSTGLRTDRKGASAWVPAILLGLSLWTFASELGLLCRELGIRGIPEAVLEKLKDELDKFRERGPIVLVFVLGIAPAVTEELFFRGYLFSAFGSRMKPGATILSTAAIFAFFHLLTKGGLAVERLAPTFLMGLVLGWVAWRSGSVIPGMILHVCHNSTIALLAYYQEAIERKGWLVSENDHLPKEWLAVAAGVAAVGFLGMQLLTRARAKPQAGPLAA